MPRALSATDVEDFRDRLCDAATKIFAEKGLSGFTMRELASAIGVSAMTPYRYFKDKEDILAAVRARAFDSFADVMEAAFASVSTDPIAKANAAGEAYIRFAFENPQSYHLMFEVNQAEDGAYPDLTRAADRAKATLTQHIHPLVERGLLHGDPELLGYVFWAALHGVVSLKLADKLEPPKYGFENVRDELFRALTFGLANQTSQ
ncbi:MAG TPA: TetR/AcrR family transcriptional regulator [Rhizomicrobium sp.]|jgi:AcrR family transcriptional regulator